MIWNQIVLFPTTICWQRVTLFHLPCKSPMEWNICPQYRFVTQFMAVFSLILYTNPYDIFLHYVEFFLRLEGFQKGNIKTSCMSLSPFLLLYTINIYKVGYFAFYCCAVLIRKTSRKVFQHFCITTFSVLCNKKQRAFTTQSLKNSAGNEQNRDLICYC